MMVECVDWLVDGEQPGLPELGHQVCVEEPPAGRARQLQGKCSREQGFGAILFWSGSGNCFFRLQWTFLRTVNEMFEINFNTCTVYTVQFFSVVSLEIFLIKLVGQ